MSDWLEDTEDWIDDDGAKRRSFSPQSGLTGIAYLAARCPVCKSLNIPVQNTKRVFSGNRRFVRRQHTCSDCQMCFKSYQELLPTD